MRVIFASQFPEALGKSPWRHLASNPSRWQVTSVTSVHRYSTKSGPGLAVSAVIILLLLILAYFLLVPQLGRWDFRPHDSWGMFLFVILSSLTMAKALSWCWWTYDWFAMVSIYDDNYRISLHHVLFNCWFNCCSPSRPEKHRKTTFQQQVEHHLHAMDMA